VKRILSVFLLLAAGVFGFPQTVRGQTGVVKAILFYDPAQTESQDVFNNFLPDLLAAQGNHLLLLTVDATQGGGLLLYETALASYTLPVGGNPLPLAVIGDTALAGKQQIEAELSALVSGLPAAEWPDLHGLKEILQKAGIIQSPQDTWSRFLNDQPGNSLAILVLAFLAVSLIYSILATFRQVKDIAAALPWWTILVLLGIGLSVSSYLAYTELTHSVVACGGISNCQTVQDSPYSMLFGLIPIGVFGIAGNLCILSAWLVNRFGRGRMKSLAAMAMMGFAVFGVCFSAYLTFLEPFVIGATCLWCLTSATVMGLILPNTITPTRTMLQAAVSSAQGRQTPAA
jgi:uncharacterized membrane protein